MIPADAELVLASGVVMVPAARFPAAVRAQLREAGDGAVAVTRARSRVPSTLVDHALALLLEEFRSPSTVADAIVRYSRSHGLEPADALSASYAAIRSCVTQGYLVAAGSEAAVARAPLFAPGRRIGDGTVLRIIRLLDDVELHQIAFDGRGLAALKVARAGTGVLGQEALRREAAVLRHLDGRVAPKLIAEGETAEGSWLVIEWCEGVQLSTMSAIARSPAAGRAELVGLARRVADAFAELHELGVVHGDVHPGNIVVSPVGAVRVVDFGLASIVGSPPGDDTPRGGVPSFYDPQQAEALLAGRPPPPATPASDQYAVGAVLYQLFTGRCYLDLSVDPDTMLRQIIEDKPAPFARRAGGQAWPEAEQVIGRALAKHSEQRHGSTRVLAQQLAAIAPGDEDLVTRRPGSLEGFLDSWLTTVSPGGPWFELGLPNAVPRSNVVHGAAGIATALLRVAVVRSDPFLLTLADEWITRALRDVAAPNAFSSVELGVSDGELGPISPYHRIPGVHVVHALVNHALNDAVACRQSVDAFVAASDQPCQSVDLTMGRTGTLLASAIVLEALAGSPGADTRGVAALGDHTLHDIWCEVDAAAPIAETAGMTYLGIAHGWAGVLLTTLRWCRAAGTTPPANLAERLDQLAGLARRDGISARWPVANAHGGPGSATSMPGWCHGSAGYVHLWTTAASVLRDERWAALAEQAAWHTYSTPSGAGQLCCGTGGQAYALLELYRCTGERRWLDAAHEHAVRVVASAVSAAASNPLRASLYKGDVGVCVLIAELDEPAAAAMPFFGCQP